MRKQSKEEKKTSKLKIALCIIGIIATLTLAAINIINNYNIKFKFITKLNEQQEYKDSVKNHTTVENERLVIKSTSSYNKIIEYKFKENIVEEVKVYEQFENKDQYDKKLEQYTSRNNIIILDKNEEELSIEIERKELGTDKNSTYEQVYNKYVINIIGAYDKV